MSKLVSGLYDATRTMGKIASTANDINALSKSVKTGDPSHIAKRLANKATNQITHNGADIVANNIKKLFK